MGAPVCSSDPTGKDGVHSYLSSEEPWTSIALIRSVGIYHQFQRIERCLGEFNKLVGASADVEFRHIQFFPGLLLVNGTSISTVRSCFNAEFEEVGTMAFNVYAKVIPDLYRQYAPTCPNGVLCPIANIFAQNRGPSACPQHLPLFLYQHSQRPVH